jgi:hypothetical protein
MPVNAIGPKVDLNPGSPSVAVDRLYIVEDDPRRFGFHTLRHSLASFLVRMRTDPKTVQSLLRHSDVKLTLQFYTHAVSQDRTAATGEMLLAILSHAVDQSGLGQQTRLHNFFSITRLERPCPVRVLNVDQSGLRQQEKNRVSALKTWWPGTELNRRRQPFQGCALPPELPGHFAVPPAPRGMRGIAAPCR